jgi:hypothetical protein
MERMMTTQLRAPQRRMIVPEDYGENAESAVSWTTDINGPSDYVCEVPANAVAMELKALGATPEVVSIAVPRAVIALD